MGCFLFRVFLVEVLVFFLLQERVFLGFLFLLLSIFLLGEILILLLKLGVFFSLLHIKGLFPRGSDSLFLIR